MNARGLAALARFTSETRRPLYDRDHQALREAVARLSSKTLRDLSGEVSSYLRQHPGASASEVCRAVGGRKSDVLELVRAARSLTCDEGNRVGGDAASETTENLPPSLADAPTRFPSSEPLRRQG